MKRLSRRMLIGLVACAAALAFLPGAAGQDEIKLGKDKSPKIGKAPIMAVAEDGTTWVAGEVKFKAVEDTLEVSVDLDSGIPEAWAWLETETNPNGVIVLQVTGLKTDERGNVKYTEVYSLYTKQAFEVWVKMGVVVTEVEFTPSRSVWRSPAWRSL